jgi:hypothetical protein
MKKLNISVSPTEGLIIRGSNSEYKLVGKTVEFEQATNMYSASKKAMKTGETSQVVHRYGNAEIPMIVSPHYKIQDGNKVSGKVKIDFNNVRNLSEQDYNRLKYIQDAQGFILPKQMDEALGAEGGAKMFLDMITKPLKQK